MKTITKLSIGLLCLSACAAAVGQEGERRPGGEGPDRVSEFLKRADSNADGKISKDEMTAASQRDIDDRFAKMDANSDGYVDKTEIAAIGEKLREGMRARGEGGRRPGGEGGEGGFRRPPTGDARPEGAPRPEGERPAPRPEGERPAPRPEGERPSGPRPGSGPGGSGGPGGAAFLDELFGRIDKNSDGSVDKEEYTEFSKQESEQRFGRIDANQDGKVSKDEMRSGMERLRGMMRVGPGGPPGEGGFRRPGGPGPDGEGGFRRPPAEGDKGRPRPEGEAGQPKKDAA